MARRGENIRKRKDGRWEGRYKNGVNADGRTKYSSVYGKTYNEVKEKLKNIQIVQPCQRGTTDLRFAEILRLWLISNRMRLKRSTEYKYQFMLEKHIIPELGMYKVSALTSLVINTFLEKKLKSGSLYENKTLAPSYVRTLAVLIQSALKFATDENLCIIPKTHINKPFALKRDLKVLSSTVSNYIENMMRSDINETKLGILIALNTGMRIGEICALSWEDIDLINLLIHVRHTVSRIKAQDGTAKTQLILDTPKTKSSVRDIPINSTLLPILRLMKTKAVSHFVVSVSPSYVSTRTFDYRYRRVMESIGVPVVNFHALRHTFATRCVEAGVDVKSLSEVLGHANVNITLNTYVHPSMELKRIQMEKICSYS